MSGEETYRTGRCSALTTDCKRCPNAAVEGEAVCGSHREMDDGNNHTLVTIEDSPATLLSIHAVRDTSRGGRCRARTKGGSRCTGWTVPHEPWCKRPHTWSDDVQAVVPDPDDDDLDQVRIRKALAAVEEDVQTVAIAGKRIERGEAAAQQTGLGAFAGGAGDAGGACSGDHRDE